MGQRERIAVPSNTVIDRSRAIVGFAVVAFAFAACAQDTVDPGGSSTQADGGAGDPGGGGPGDSGAAPGADGGGASGSDSGSPTGSDASQPPPTGSDASQPPPDTGGGPVTPPQDAECDFNGRWLVAQRILATAIGQDQAGHNWFYYEVQHQGQNLVVTKGLHCGYDVKPKTSLAATVDSSPAWPGILINDSSAGRKGTYVKSGSNCTLHFDKEYVVRGATVSHYSDPSVALPTKDQAASGTTPGWEDWDNDGNPGISLKVTSPLASGTLYTAQRDWTQYDGTTPLSSTKFEVAVTWDGEQGALGRSADSSSAIESTSAPSSDATQHFVWFYKLANDQAVGADADICAAVRTLKDTFVPEANQ
jgi:hypothetical protein